MKSRRSEMLQALRAEREAGRPIIGCGAGTGLSAKSEVAGGADFIVIYNSGRYRMGGRGSLAGLMPYGSANDIVIDMGSEVLPVVGLTPVLAGVCGTDPFKIMDVFLRTVQAMGFAGVQNFPSVGGIDGEFRANLEATGMGYGQEVAMINLAVKMDLFTSPYVFNPDEAAAMADVGCDQIVAHVGTTTSGTIGASHAPTFDEAVEAVGRMAETARRRRPDVLVLFHGGPFDEPETVGRALKLLPEVDGFLGASAMERLPVERAIKTQVSAFKALRDGRAL